MEPSSVLAGDPSWFTIAAVILTAVGSWTTQHLLYRHKRADEKRDQQAKNDASLEIHRDELTFELLQNARMEMASARVEVEDLREEVRKLRSMENHFYYFQQSLDHLEALLFPESDEARAAAERNARAFLTRMRRLNEAKGTIANEVQRAASTVELLGKDPVVGKKEPDHG